MFHSHRHLAAKVKSNKALIVTVNLITSPQIIPMSYNVIVQGICNLNNRDSNTFVCYIYIQQKSFNYMKQKNYAKCLPSTRVAVKLL